MVILLGGLIPFILIQLRKQEIAIMHSLGTSKITAFLSFFIEQAALCITGSVAGIAIWKLLVRENVFLSLKLFCLFMLCWFIGASVSLRIINSHAVQAILRAEE